MFFENGCVPEWPNGADCKSAVFDFGGSNPSAPTQISFCGSPAEVLRKARESLHPLLVDTKTCARFFRQEKSRGNSSVDRALAFQAGGRGFESRFPLFAALAQW